MNVCVASGQLYRLCWSLWNNTEERIDLDAEEESHEEVGSALEEGNLWLLFVLV